MSGLVKVGGAWKDVSGLSVNIGGTWKDVTSGSVNIAGTWKEFYAPATGDIGDFDLLQSEVLTGSAASVTFSGLDAYASTYQHLQIRFAFRSSRAADADWANGRFNGDSSSSYTYHNLFGNGSAVYSNGAGSQNYLGLIGNVLANSSPANAYTAAVVDILDPFNTSKNTTIRNLSGNYGPANDIRLGSGLWNNTAAVTSFTITSGSGNNWVSGSRFSLFGVKKA